MSLNICSNHFFSKNFLLNVALLFISSRHISKRLSEMLSDRNENISHKHVYLVQTIVYIILFYEFINLSDG